MLRLHAWHGGERPRRLPIDTFLRALAADQDRNAAAVVMSGTGSDGTLGVRAVKDHGGLAVAEALPGERAGEGFSGMPQSAVATGLVDFLVPAHEMPAHLAAYARHLRQLAHGEGVENAEEAAGSRVREICAILLAREGRDFRHYKTNTLVRRIQRRMQVLQIDAAASYVERLREDTDEVERLAHELLIHVTSFFRDPEAFEALKQEALHPLVREKAADQPVRIWVPGCSTGEEAVSIAILAREVRVEADRFPPIQVFATDADKTAIESARTGRYPKAVAADIAPERLRTWFVEEAEHYRVTKDLRDVCIFSVHDLIQNPPFSRLDLIACRNVLIYFDTELQRRLIPVFHYALREGGYLFLGASETVAQQRTLFTALEQEHRLYRQQPQPRAAREPADFPFLAASQAPDLTGTPEAPVAPQSDVSQRVEKLVLDSYGPPFVVVDEQYSVVQYSRRTGAYLEQPVGAPRSNLLDLGRPGLRADLRAALDQARERAGEAVRAGVSLRTDAGTELVDIVAMPVDSGSAARRYVVVFRPNVTARAADVPHSDDGAAARDADAAERRVRQLEYELMATKEDLQTTIEELETSNEELKSANEELLSMNEELQSSNEDLETAKKEVQSVNQELTTVNEELSRKVAELDQANADLRNLFQSTDVATVFLDRRGRITWYTPAATWVFNLIDSDVGRPITDITARVELTDLSGDIDDVLRSATPVEREVSGRDRPATYVMRALPYRDCRDRVDGVVLTFVDVTRTKADERRQRMLTAALQHRVNGMLATVRSLERESLETSTTLGEFAERFEGRLNALATTETMIARTGGERVDLHELVEEALPWAVCSPEAFTTDGPTVAVPRRAGQLMALALNELLTNAVKHGALAAPAGGIAVSWQVVREAAPPMLHFAWHEHGLSERPNPDPEGGFGLNLIRNELPPELDARVDLRFDADGFSCSIALPLDEDASTAAGRGGEGG